MGIRGNRVVHVPLDECVADSRRINELLKTLSRRERDVLKCMVDGLNNNEGAETLVVSLGTVKYHVSNIFHKLGVDSRVEAGSATSGELIRFTVKAQVVSPAGLNL